MSDPFPTDPSEFDQDNRISFSKLDSKYLGVLDDGSEYEFDAQLRKWTLVDDAMQADDYGGRASADEEDEGINKKRKHDPEGGRDDPDSSRSSRANKKVKPAAKPRQNTAVYVTGLPLDVTIAKIHDLFSRKGGLVAEEIDSGKPRIKLYKDESGSFKGDALVVFFKPESVRMAIMLLDDTDFRYASDGKGEGRMRVQEADASYKKTQYEQGAGNGSAERGSQADNRRPKSEADRKKVIKKTQKLDTKLADWSDEEDERFPSLAEAKSKSSKRVILRQMFRIFEIEEDLASILEIKEDIREECSKLGTVTSVTLYDQEPEGIVAVKFREVAGAEACVKAMNGRPFDGRVVEASLALGKEKFRMSDRAKDGDDDVSE